ncbi:hypothetical protein E8E14_002999 [Neopestalotiopsis sp. 37M]|nr:hypothetical protein E8E14_002999 [Neopestalotiopsis sp. 37M]
MYRTSLFFTGQISSLVTLSHDLVGLCCEFFSTVKDAPQELKDVRREVTEFENCMTSLHFFINAHPDQIDKFMTLSLPNGTLDAASSIIKELVNMLEVGKSAPSTGPKRAKLMHTALERIQLGLKKTDIKEPLEKLRRIRDSIQFTLTAAIPGPILETKKDIGFIKQSMQALQKDQTDFQDESRKLEALKWFKVDISANRKMHKERLAQQEKSTCHWFTRNPAWEHWLTRRKFIWVTGLPGTGKTVLASYLIEQASHAFNSKGVAYYYCHHSRNRDETMPLLQHIVKQLISQINYVPTTIYDRHNRADKLDMDDLLLCLQELAHKFETGVRVIIDAVDESKPRHNLMSLLLTLGTDERFRKLSLLVTSRPEPDIVERMRPYLEAIHEISMANPGVQRDIQSFVHSELVKLPWPETLKEDVEASLVGGAKGMFRWVACQLDHVRRLGRRGLAGEGAILNALRNLPDDLFETYERILLEIPEEDKEFARTALALMCSKHGDMPTAELLVEACLCRVMSEDINKYDVNLLTEICGCLLRISVLHRPPPSVFDDPPIGRLHNVSLAHYTVKEYLVHPNTATRSAKFFALTPQVLETIDLLVAFKGLQRFGTRHSVRNGNKVRVTRYEEECLRKTEDALRKRRSDFEKNDELYQALLQSLKYLSPHANHLRVQRGITKAMGDNYSTWERLINHLETPPSGQRSEQVVLLLNLVTLNWQPMVEKYLKSHPDFTALSQIARAAIWTDTFKLRALRGQNQAELNQNETLLSYCVRKRLLSFLTTFITHGASFENEPEVLYSAMYSPDKDFTHSSTTLKFLKAMLDLGSGAKTDPVPRQAGARSEKNAITTGFAFTPLQVAVALQEHEWVEVLLEASAKPNAVGSPRGRIPHGYDRGNNSPLESLRPVCGFTPLSINKRVVPSDNEDVAKNIEIERLLLRWGAILTPSSAATQAATQGASQTDAMEISDDE